jgi:branched-chain amino acid transport system permease protein
VARDDRLRGSDLLRSPADLWERARTPFGWLAGSAALWAVLAAILPKGLPVGIVMLGIIYGAIYAVLAVGIVLIYRGDRIINFAQAQIGVLPAVLAIELIVTYGVNYVWAVLAGLAAAALLGAVISLLPRHFRNSSRLILTVATIGLAQLLTGVSALVPTLFCNPATNESCVNASNSQSVNTPLHASFTVGPVLFSGNDIVAVAVAVLAASALALFLRFSRYGLAIRAAAENSDRATLLGISVARLDTIIWVLAAVLSALAILLQVPVLGFGGFQTVTAGGDEILLRILAAAVIGRMESLPRTVAAAVLIGVFDAGATWTYANTTYVDATLVVVIIVALLFQRRSRLRTTEAERSTWRAVAAVRPIPRPLANLAEVRWTVRGLKVAFVALVATLPLILSDSQTYLASLIVIYAIVGLSLLVLTGWTGQISLGQFGLAGIGGATTVLLYSRHGWDFFAALAAGVAVGALVSLVIGLPALRMSGPFFAVTTLAFGVSASSYFLVPNYLPWFVTTEANRPTLFGHNVLNADWQIYYFCLAGFFLVLLAVRSLRQSRTGRALIATRDNEPAARAAAINTTRQKLIAFAVSGAIAGFAGALFAVQQRGINSGSFTADTDIALFSMVVIGGLGSLPGVILGAVAVWSAQYFLPNGYALLANGLGIVLLLIFLPEGIGGLLYNGRDRLLRVVARRRHISTPGIWRAPDDADTTAAPGTRITAPGTPPAIPGTAGAPATTPATAAAPTPEPDSPAVAGTPHG